MTGIQKTGSEIRRLEYIFSKVWTKHVFYHTNKMIMWKRYASALCKEMQKYDLLDTYWNEEFGEIWKSELHLYLEERTPYKVDTDKNRVRSVDKLSINILKRWKAVVGL